MFGKRRAEYAGGVSGGADEERIDGIGNRELELPGSVRECRGRARQGGDSRGLNGLQGNRIQHVAGKTRGGLPRRQDVEQDANCGRTPSPSTLHLAPDRAKGWVHQEWG